VATGMTSTTIRSLLTLLTLLTLLLLLLFLPPRRPIDPAKSPPEPFPESNPTEPSSRSIRPPPTPIVLPDGTRASSTFRPFAPKTPATPRPREAEWNIPRRWCDWIKRSRSWSWRSWNRRGNRRGNRIPIIPLLLLMGVDRAEFDSASRPSIKPPADRERASRCRPPAETFAGVVGTSGTSRPRRRIADITAAAEGERRPEGNGRRRRGILERGKIGCGIGRRNDGGCGCGKMAVGGGNGRTRRRTIWKKGKGARGD